MTTFQPTAADLADKIMAVMGGQLIPDGVHVTVNAADRSITVKYDERVMRTPLRVLGDRFGKRHALDDPETMRVVFHDWLATRPASDAEATREGLTALAWSDDRHTAVGWAVYVIRSGYAVPWVPSPDFDQQAVIYTRFDAMIRGIDTEQRIRPVDQSLLFESPVSAALSTSVLGNPEVVERELREHGVRCGNPFAVISPGRPVAVTSEDTARRLAAEATQPHVIMPLQRATTLGWTYRP